jgi:hypothetical protein
MHGQQLQLVLVDVAVIDDLACLVIYRELLGNQLCVFYVKIMVTHHLFLFQRLPRSFIHCYRFASFKGKGKSRWIDAVLLALAQT